MTCAVCGEPFPTGSLLCSCGATAGQARGGPRRTPVIVPTDDDRQAAEPTGDPAEDPRSAEPDGESDPPERTRPNRTVRPVPPPRSVCADPGCAGPLPEGADVCPYCRRPVDPAEAAPQDTRPDDGSNADATGSTLPAALANRFEIVERLPTSGAEADLYIVDDHLDGERSVLKLYRDGIDVSIGALDRLATANVAHVVTIKEHGPVEARHYELLEYVNGGTIADLQRRKGPRLDEAIIRETLQELADAVEHLHQLGLKHGDITPSSILVRTETPFDLVLADFGLAAIIDTSLVFRGEMRRSRRYAAPEQLSGAEGLPPDVWALGVVVLELMLGRHPLADLADETLDYHLLNRAWPISPDLVDDERLRQLFRGVLQRDPEQRWEIGHVQAWLAGRSTPGVDPARRGAIPEFAFRGGTYITRSGVARALVGDWEPGAAHVANGALRNWVAECGDDPVLLEWLDDLARGPWGPSGQLIRAALRLDPGLPQIYGGYRIDVSALAGLAASAVIGGPTSPEGRAVLSLLDQDVLNAFGELAGSSDHRDLAAYLVPELQRLDAGLAMVAANDLEVDEQIRDLARIRLLQLLVDYEERERLARKVGARLPREVPAWYRDLVGDDATVADLIVASAVRDLVLERAADQRRTDRAARLDQRATATNLEARLARNSRVPVALIAGGIAAIAPVPATVGVVSYAAASRYGRLVRRWASSEAAVPPSVGRILSLPFVLLRSLAAGLLRLAGDTILMALLIAAAAIGLLLVANLVVSLTELPLTVEQIVRRALVPVTVATTTFLLIRARPESASFPAASHLAHQLRLAPLTVLIPLWGVAIGGLYPAWDRAESDPLAAFEANVPERTEQIEAWLDRTFGSGTTRGPASPSQPPSSEVDDSEAERSRWAVRGASALNIRTEPGTDAAIVGSLPEGESLPATGQQARVGNTDWIELELPDGSTGWSSSRYLEELP